MKLKTHAFVAKQYAKKHYANAVESVKTLKSKITKTHSNSFNSCFFSKRNF